MKEFIRPFIQTIIDFIFPPTVEELQLRQISPEKLSGLLPRASATEFPYIRSLFSYKDPLVKELIWQIKYKRNQHAIKCAGYALYNELLKYGDKLVLIPIPISKKRRKERGYNQCELLIDEICRLDIDSKFIKKYDLLFRPRHIEHQTVKNRNERIENINNIFEVKGEISRNCQILIIDDVTTTGSTIREARDVLLKNGYKNVSALTVAH